MGVGLFFYLGYSVRYSLKAMVFSTINIVKWQDCIITIIGNKLPSNKFIFCEKLCIFIWNLNKGFGVDCGVINPSLLKALGQVPS